MKIPFDPRLPGDPVPTMGWLQRLATRLTETHRGIAVVLNGIAAGHVAAHSAFAAAPTAGTWAQGDFVRNSAPAEAGGAGSKYVITGWICTASGTPGTWLECRALTGN